LAILKIQEHYTFDEVLFWGRVEGIEKDYYIAMGIQYKG
jgi:radial spoke head protein 9